MNILWGKAESFWETPKKGRSKISAKIWPPVSEVLDPLVTSSALQWRFRSSDIAITNAYSTYILKFHLFKNSYSDSPDYLSPHSRPNLHPRHRLICLLSPYGNRT